MANAHWLDQAELQLQQTGDEYDEADVKALAEDMQKLDEDMQES